MTVSETGLTIVEGSSDSYTVVLDTQPAGTVTVTVSGHAGTDVSLDKTTLTFSTTTWSTAQEVTVTAGQDGDADDEADVTLSHTVGSTADAAYNGIAAGSVTVSINDNDTAGVTVSKTGLTIVEGSSDSYTVVLDTQPAGTVTVTVSGHAGTDASLDKTTLTFSTTNWSTAQEVTVTAGQDADADDEADVTLSHAVASPPPMPTTTGSPPGALPSRSTTTTQRGGDRLQDGADHRGGEQRQLHGGAGHPARRDSNSNHLWPR